MGLFGEYLVANGRLTPERLGQTMGMQSQVAGRLGTNLLELGLIDEDALLEALGQFRSTRTVSAYDLKHVPASLLRLVPPKIAHRYRVIPVERKGHTLTLASTDPGDPLVEDELGILTACLVRTYIGLELRIHEALEKYYGVPQPARLSGLAKRLDRGKGAAVVEDTPAATESFPAEPPASSPVPLPAPASPPAPVAVPERPAASEDAAPVDPEIEFVELDQETLELIYAKPPDDESPDSRLDFAASELLKVDIRDEVADIIFDYCRPYFSRRILLIHRGEQVIGWRGEGEGVDNAKVRDIDISAKDPSIFLSLLQGTKFWLGSVAPLPANLQLLNVLGDPAPKGCLVLPITLRSRVICFVYGDNGSDGVSGAPMDELQRLMQKVGVAFEICILKNKIRAL